MRSGQCLRSLSPSLPACDKTKAACRRVLSRHFHHCLSLRRVRKSLYTTGGDCNAVHFHQLQHFVLTPQSSSLAGINPQRSSEELFEQALYGGLFAAELPCLSPLEASPTPSPSSTDDIPKGSEASKLPDEAFVSSEAAFERALYGEIFPSSTVPPYSSVKVEAAPATPYSPATHTTTTTATTRMSAAKSAPFLPSHSGTALAQTGHHGTTAVVSSAAPAAERSWLPSQVTYPLCGETVASWLPSQSLEAGIAATAVVGGAVLEGPMGHRQATDSTTPLSSEMAFEQALYAGLTDIELPVSSAVGAPRMEEAQSEAQKEKETAADDGLLISGPLFSADTLPAAGTGAPKEVNELPVVMEDREGYDAALRDVAERSPLAPPTPLPTSFAFALERRELDDVFTLRHALFGLRGWGTDPIHHVEPRERVEKSMPLFDPSAKEILFRSSGWLAALQSEKHELSGSTPSAVAAPPSHLEVVGRPKVLRTLLYELLRRPELWWDDVVELLSLALLEDGRYTEGQVREAMRAVFGVSPDDVVWFSVELVQMIEDLLLHCATPPATSDAAKMGGPLRDGRGSWFAYLLSHRHEGARLYGPHRPPFSFGELRPTIAADDLAPLNFHTAYASGGFAAESFQTLHQRRPSEGERSSIQSCPSQEAWSGMSDEEQNAFLFSEAGARLSVRARATEGIYAIYTDFLRPSDETPSTTGDAAEGCPSKGTTAADSAIDDANSVAEKEAAEELRRLHHYDIDRILLSLVDPFSVVSRPVKGGEGDTSEGQLGNSKQDLELHEDHHLGADVSLGRRGMGTRSRFGLSADVMSGDDLHLSTLWQRFQQARTGDIVENLLHVRQCTARMVDEALLEAAVQRAFLLLFFTRDEVRAITHPGVTYTVSWTLHRQLRRWLQHRSVDKESATDLDSKSVGHLPHFEELSLYSQVSYACFGCAHVPPLVEGRPTGVVSPLGNSTVPCMPTAPWMLLAELMKVDEARKEESAMAGDLFATLTPLQQRAISFCFPLTAGEKRAMSLAKAMRHEPCEASPSQASAATSHDLPPSTVAEVAGQSDSIANAELLAVRAPAVDEVEAALMESLYRTISGLCAAGILPALLPSSWGAMVALGPAQEEVLHDAVQRIAAALRMPQGGPLAPIFPTRWSTAAEESSYGGLNRTTGKEGVVAREKTRKRGRPPLRRNGQGTSPAATTREPLTKVIDNTAPSAENSTDIDDMVAAVMKEMEQDFGAGAHRSSRPAQQKLLSNGTENEPKVEEMQKGKRGRKKKMR